MENVCKDNPIECPCQKPNCPNHGKCCVCIAAHKEKGQVPFCLKDTVAQMMAQ